MAKLNDIKWRVEEGVDYGYDLTAWKRKMDGGKPLDCESDEVWVRTCIKELLDNCLWAWIAYVLKIPFAHHPFIVSACVEVQRMPVERRAIIWARGHCKSTIVTCAAVMQLICRNPEKTVLLMSYTRGAALKFFNQIKRILEESGFLKFAYVDALYADPIREAHKWSEDAGLFLKRKSFAKEPNLYASGLLEGMPVGGHYDLIVPDDVMVEDLVNSPGQVELLKERFAVSKNLLNDGGWIWVVGTPYTPDDLIQVVRGQVRGDGKPVYCLSFRPATEGGEWNGKAVFLSESFLEELRMNPRKFGSQQLLNPTPDDIRKLNWQYVKFVEPQDVPKNLFKFMVIDPAGERKDRVGDAWAIEVWGVEPYRDDVGASDVYLLDACLEDMPIFEALDRIVKMYVAAGRIMQLGVEKVGQSTMEMHVAAALRSKGKNLSVESGNLKILKPGGRTKAERVEGALVWPLNNGKIHISKAVPGTVIDRLKCEFDRFPMWHDDGIDAAAYLYDMLKDYKFGLRPSSENKKKDPQWLREWRSERGSKSWMVV